MTVICAFLFGILTTMIISYTTYKVTQTLKENRTSLVENTRKLFKSLIRALLLDLFIYIFNVNTIIIIICITYVFFSSYLLIVAMLMFMLLCFWPFLAVVILMVFVGPYRR